MSIMDFCRNVNFKFNLLELLYFLFVLVLIAAIALVIKKIGFILRTERKIDEHLRETRARISRIVKEIEGNKDRLSEVEVVKVKEKTTNLTQTYDKLTTEFIMETLSQALINEPKQLNDNRQHTSELVQQKLNIETSVWDSTPTEAEYAIPLPPVEMGVSRSDQKEDIQEVSELIPKGKKTRAMSMEERWADYDKKRSMRNTA